ncbi:MAG: 3-methylcrotonyl-CoA carboxylase [Gammaproteobacteria bacterium]|nr:MAG: 3-methylcrotonyl-CoA carboxylase [Gammaproteobacteria bacterium]
MFRKLLIANRGEIACRIIKTAQKMGVHCIAVYSEADKNALFVQMADEAYSIGPAEAAKSYLRAEHILDIARASGAEAIHPGYGFLSENAHFADLCEQNGIQFVGPSSHSIRSMGSKSEAKKLMEQASVPLVPGYHGDQQDEATLKSYADKIGYPVLLKASAGGGGKGMRVVSAAEEFSAAYSSAKREASSSFGNDHLLIEKYITEPRHVEIQLLCDNHGNAVYLHDRDCSVQRRHQKVIEEAPAPWLSDKTRTAMGMAAIACAKAIDYSGAGTVEFLLDIDESFYFMEMNTRLQVEHPVTEMITGIDLVEWQLRVANGESLEFKQENIPCLGHSFEARVYAENPYDSFLPTPGHIHYMATPEPGKYVRVDTGIKSGDDISIYYDPMIAKLIVWDETRSQAINRMQKALADFRLAGVTNNLSFLAALFAEPAFQSGKLSTLFIEENQHKLLVEPAITDDILALAGIARTLFLFSNEAWSGSGDTGGNGSHSADKYSPWNQQSTWRLNSSGVEAFELIHGTDAFVYQTEFSNDHLDSGAIRQFGLSFGDTKIDVRAELSGSQITANLNERRIKYNVQLQGDSLSIFTGGASYCFDIALDYDSHEADEYEHSLLAPMHGKIIAVNVSIGDQVNKGDTLMLMEAMKMEHTITAHESGEVAGIFYREGDNVEEGAELIELASAEDATDNPASSI